MWFGGGGWWMALSMLVFWGGVVVLAVWGVRALSGDRRPQDRDTRNRALDILEERFARGEIDREEFEQRRVTLESR